MMTQTALPLEGSAPVPEPIMLDPLVAVPRRSGLFPRQYLWMVEVCEYENLEEVVVSRVVAAPTALAALKYAQEVLIPTAVINGTVDNEPPAPDDFVISSIVLVSWEAAWTDGVNHVHLDYVLPKAIE